MAESGKVDTMGTSKSGMVYPSSQVTRREHNMSKKHFTEEQMLALKGNPNVARVSKLSISFTEAFKRKTYGELLSGKPIWQIFAEQGLDTEALGPVRVLKFQQFVNDCAKRGDGFRNRNRWDGKKEGCEEIVTNNHVKSLEHEVAYLRQVVEFLKKTRQADSEAKK